MKKDNNKALTPTTHSKIGASSMHRWAACPGSVKLSEGMPNYESPYALEGTTAHDLAAAMLLDQDVGRFYIDVTDPEDPRFVDDEMLEAVYVYVEAFKEARKNAKFWQVETSFSLEQIHPGLFGTSDGIIYNEDKLELEVWDYKHGAGLPVEVNGNEQLMYYGLGALLNTGVKVKTIKLTIVQPRCPHPDGPIRSWSISAADLIDFSADLVDAAKRTEDPKAELKAGDHCKFCRASPVCPQLNELAIENAKNDFLPKAGEVVNFDSIGEKLSKSLEIIPALEAWIKSVKMFAHNEAERGRIPDGFKLVQKRATRKWIDEDRAKEFIAFELGLNEDKFLKPRELRSPAQIETLLKKEEKKLIEAFVVKQSSGNTLVSISDGREAIAPSVEAEFKKLD